MIHRGINPDEIRHGMAMCYMEHGEELVEMEKDIVKNGVGEWGDEFFNG